MNNTAILRKLPLAVAIAATSLTFNAFAQTNPSPTPTGTPPSSKGENFPNDPNAAANKPTPKVIQKAENSRPAKATKRVAKKTGNVVSNAAKKTGNAVENTGDKIASKLPPAKNPSDLQSNGTPKVAP